MHLELVSTCLLSKVTVKLTYLNTEVLLSETARDIGSGGSLVFAETRPFPSSENNWRQDMEMSECVAYSTTQQHSQLAPFCTLGIRSL